MTVIARQHEPRTRIVEVERSSQEEVENEDGTIETVTHTWTEQVPEQYLVLLSETVDNGDGTGTITWFDDDGEVTNVEQIELTAAAVVPSVSDALGKLKTATSLAKVREAAADLETALTAKGIT